MINRGNIVKVNKLLPHKVSPLCPELIVNNRRLNMIGEVDSPIFLTLNRHWLVKHCTSCLVDGISIGRYGIYHEDELEAAELPDINN